MNGIDAIAMATGNDFRAIEACAHAYACRSGKYSSLSNAFIKNKNFNFEIELPLSMGTVGGLTKLHPIVNWSPFETTAVVSLLVPNTFNL